MKVTSSVLALSLEFVAQSGPTWDPLPPFRWADQGSQSQVYNNNTERHEFRFSRHSPRWPSRPLDVSPIEGELIQLFIGHHAP